MEPGMSLEVSPGAMDGVEDWVGQRYSRVNLTDVQKGIICAGFNAVAKDGVIDPYEVEGLVADLLECTLTDAILDTIIDLTDDDVEHVDSAAFEHIMSAVLSQTTQWGVLRNSISGVVGIGTLVEQEQRRSLKRGFDFNCMVVGEAGLGKTTLINTLFKSPVSRRNPGIWEPTTSTTQILTSTHVVEERGVRLRLSLTDSPGFGDQINNEQSFDSIIQYLNTQHRTYLQSENSTERPPKIPDTRVHALLYFIAPTGHGLKPLDIAFMKGVDKIVNLVPVIAKADALTLEERDAFKARIREDIEENGIQVFPWNLQEDDAEDERAKAEAKARLPFAVIGASEEFKVNGQYVRGRKTKTGFIDVDNHEHCEFALLRDALIRVYLCDLKETTAQVHYENFRRQQLASEASVA